MQEDTLIQIQGQNSGCKIVPPTILIRVHTIKAVSYLVFAALTQLQAGQDLALNGLDPRVPLIHTLAFKVPSLASARHDEEVKVILI